MSVEDDLKLERFKLVTDRQKYFTELARGTFASYVKVFTALAVAGIMLISARSKLDLRPDMVPRLVYAVAGLVTFLGIVSIGQIVFCLVRWKGYRKAEQEINPDSPRMKRWWWVFEGLYCVTIAISTVAVWVVSWSLLSAIVKPIS